MAKIWRSAVKAMLLLDNELSVLGDHNLSGDDEDMPSALAPLTNAPSCSPSSQQLTRKQRKACDRFQQWPAKAKNQSKKTKLDESQACLAALKRKKTRVRIWKEAVADAPSRTTRNRTAATEGPVDPSLGDRNHVARQKSGRNTRSRKIRVVFRDVDSD